MHASPTRVCVRAGATACARVRAGVRVRACVRVCLQHVFVCKSLCVCVWMSVRVRLHVSVSVWQRLCWCMGLSVCIGVRTP